MNMDKLANVLSIKAFAKKIFSEVEKFEKNIPEEYFVIAEINCKKIFLEEISNLDDKLLIFTGKDISTKSSTKVFINPYDLNFSLSSYKIENSEQKRKPIGFSNI